MPYSFFFSYAHQDNDDFLKLFHDELSNAVRQKGGETEEGKVSFFDQREMFGTQWSPKLVRAAQLSRVMVCVYSPSYFGSPNCGREWKLFELRRELYLKQQRDADEGEDDSIPPPVILPVIWRQPPSPLPGPAAGVDPYLGGKDALYNVEGMYKVTRLNKSRFDAEFLDFIEKLSDEIVKRGRRYRLPDLPAEEYGDFNAISSAFDEEPPAPAPAGLVITEPKPLGPNSVQFVFAAGSPAEFIAAKMAKKLTYKRQPQPYVQNGGSDWRPYDPKQRIRPYVTHIASGGGLDFDVDVIECDERLTDRIGEAKQRRNLVIILVDSWTLDLEKYEKILGKLHVSKNCSILIPWNEKDPDLTREQRARLEKKVRETFDNWWGVVTPLYFCYTIHSADDLDNKIRETLKALRDSFVNELIADNTQEIPRALDRSIPKPDISNK